MMQIRECIISEHGKSCIYTGRWRDRIITLLCIKLLEILYHDVHCKLPDLRDEILLLE